MKAWVYLGAKVVCIKGAPKSAIDGPAPQTNGIYTIRGFYHGPCWDQILLEEFRNDTLFHPDGHEVGWDIRRFRPLRKRKTDIAIFEAMLTGSKERERA